MKRRRIILALLGLAFAVFVNALWNGFVWDDPIILARQLPIFRSLAAVLFPPAGIPQFAPDYYRPLVIVSYLLDQSISGSRAWWFHFTVVFAHVLTTFVVFVFGEALFRRVPGLSTSRATTAAALGAALFAVHPVHTEAVAWVAGRADVFATLLGTVALYFHLCSQTRPRLALASGASWLGALLAKEVAVSTALLFPLLDALLPLEPAHQPRAVRKRRPQGSAGPTERQAWVARYWPLAAAVLVYGILRLSAIGLAPAAKTEAQASASIGMLVVAVGVYASKLLVPISLNAYNSELPTGSASIAVGAAAIAAIFGGAYVAWRRGRTVIAFLLAWIAVTLAPSLTILLKIPDVPVAERYLYFPSVGFCLLAGYLAAAGVGSVARSRRWLTWGAILTILILAAGATVSRNRIWASDLTLWADAAEKSPRTGMPLRSLGAALVRVNQLEAAQSTLEEALKRDNSVSGRATILSNLGTIALTRGEVDHAEALYQRAAAARETPDVVYNLGVISLNRANSTADPVQRQEHAHRALTQLEEAESANPRDADVELALAQALSLLDRPAEARPHYERALGLGLSESNAARVRDLLQTGK